MANLKLLPTSHLLIFSDHDGSYHGWNTMANIIAEWRARGKSDGEITDMVNTLNERGWVGSHETLGTSVVVEKYIPWDLRGMVREGEIKFEAVALMLKV